MATQIAFGQLRSIGATALQLTTEKYGNVTGVTIKALGANVNKVYVGKLGVTTTTGYELSAGNWDYFEVTDPSTLYVISAGTGDHVCYKLNY